MQRKRADSSGFTLIEVAVTLFITAILMSFIAGISRSSERTILLLREKTLLISNLNKVKSMAMTTLLDERPACGFGIYIQQPDRYTLFQDLSPVGDVSCSGASRTYSGVAENLAGEENRSAVHILPEGVRFRSSRIQSVIFIPPEPRVVMRPAVATADIVLETEDRQSSAGIRINVAGLITEY